jgi:hypothetical protein
MHSPARPVTPEIAEKKQLPREVRGAQEANIHPVLGEIAIGASLWFLVVVWVSFAAGTDTGLPLAMVTLVFVISFGLLMLVGSYSWRDPRWSFPQRNLRDFMKCEVGLESGRVTGREALIQIALVPVTLALAATLIGIVWLALD